VIVEQGSITGYSEVLECLTEDDFKEYTWRQNSANSPHKDTETVYLRMPVLSTIEQVFEDLECYNTSILVNNIEIQDVILDCMYLVGASKLARTMVIKLNPNGVITEHLDEGDYCAKHRRYHLPLLTNDQVTFTSKEESYVLKEGVLYELENKEVHGVINNSDKPRVHLVMDMQLIREE
jgi:aspartyl/asparaginyl beta-hydroxylase (cupin superfamily)